MSIDLLVSEAEQLAESYCLASGGDDERKAAAAFHRLLVAIEGLKMEGHKHLANKILVDALHDATRRIQAAQVEALATIKGAA